MPRYLISFGSKASGRTCAKSEKPCKPGRLQGFDSVRDRGQTTRVKMRIARNTLWALCTAIPIQALRYRFVGDAMANISRSVPGIATCEAASAAEGDSRRDGRVPLRRPRASLFHAA
jgi:hypothetical protein